ncbi:hypothetical protein [Paramylibacter ulvae]|uniref:hypothetical protein n=1 Tax=Paramylibacter ulvae TaxID=1651968 RepID=UPI0016789797|nr:hypothetical protein [Amylibacter ulvae]
MKYNFSNIKLQRSSIFVWLSLSLLAISKPKRLLSILIGFVCALNIFSSSVLAQISIETVPKHAHAKSYGDGWECDIGYRIKDSGCFAVFVPENGLLTNRSYGPGWECHHGYKETKAAACVKVDVPLGGFLAPSGDKWHCLRGYQKLKDSCQELIIPTNAYLVADTYHSAWKCERGYEAINDICTAIKVPSNAFLNGASYGQPWTCERKFFQRDDQCKAIVIPTNGYFDTATYGKGWKCERGYSESGDICEALIIPTNAHLNRSGNRWECHQNFRKTKGQCILDN